MGYIGGDLQERFVERIRGVDPARLLAVPIDVGKASAAAMVCDFWGEVVMPPFTFPLTTPGVQVFTSAVAKAEALRDAAWVRAGLEQAGHYHRTLLVRLEQVGIEVALLNPAQVKENPSGEETHAAARYSWMSPPNTSRRRTSAALRSLTAGHRVPIGV